MNSFLKAYMPAIVMFLIALGAILYPQFFAALIAATFLFFAIIYALIVYSIRSLKIKGKMKPQGSFISFINIEPNFRQVTGYFIRKFGFFAQQE